MKIQNLAIIFIIIILPISLVLASYTKTRVETLNLQAEYDTKLNSATYDALKAYQVNSLQNKVGGLANSKIRDINASINTFFNSMQSNFPTLGYTKESIQNYVPAIVYTMYDGYYVYAPFTNTWGTNSSNQSISTEMEEQIKTSSQTKYKDGQELYDLKPYVYYSCRYIRDNIDVVITYSLDNYIQIQGNIGGETVSRYGYLLNNLKINGNTITYEGVNIEKENGKNLKESVYVGGNVNSNSYQCLKKNGTKYYSDGLNAFTVSNGERINQDDPVNSNSVVEKTTAYDVENNDSARKYFLEAQELKSFMEEYGLTNLTTDDIVDVDTGNKYETGKSPYTKLGKIFDFDCSEKGGIESEKSNFNLHRIDVIKNAIERNLSIVIANYDTVSKTQTDFRLPKLKDSDWDKITDNIGIISFFQNVNIGGKVYSGYSIVSNTKNEDVVTYDSIYIKDSNNVCHSITENFAATNTNLSGAVGVFNVDIERRSEDDSNQNSGYYFPVYATLSYDSIITKNNISKASNQSMKEYVNSLSLDLKKIYYTALARERYGVYRVKLKI